MKLKNRDLKSLIDQQDERFIFFDYLPEAYLVLDSSYNIIWGNKQFLNITRESLDTIIDTGIQTVFPDYCPYTTATAKYLFITTPIKTGNTEYFLVKLQTKNIGEELKENSNDKINLHDTDNYYFKQILSIITEVCFKLDTDHKITYANEAAWQTWDKGANEILGQNIFSVLDQIYAPIKALLDLALRSNHKVSKEVYLSKIGRWIFINIHPETTGFIILHSDITEKIKYRENLQQKETQLTTLIENVPDLVTRWNSNVQLLFANTSFAKTKRNSFIKSQLEPKKEIKSSDWNKKIKQAFLTGNTFNHHTTLSTKDGLAYLESSIIPEKNADGKTESVLVISRDVTESKISAQKILDAKNFLQSVFDASVNGIVALKTIRNDGHEIIDYKCVLSNNASIKILGYDPHDINLASVISGKTQRIYFDKLRNLEKDAHRIEEEIFYDFKGREIWLHIVVEKLNDGLLLTFSDITKRKEAQKETIRALSLMQDLIDGTPIVLVHYKTDRDINNNIYDFTILNSNHNAAALIGISIKDLKGKRLSEITPTIFGQEFGKYLKDFADYNLPDRFETCSKQNGLETWWDMSLVKRDDGIILTALNITEKVKSEKKIKELQKQQQAKLLNAVMQTQEEERRRVAESLHNDFGQLLNIAILSLPKENKQVAEILHQAIRKMRNISYELMPPLLKDFGLEIALRDMFDIKQLSSDINISYEIKGFNTKVNNDLEVAIYRITQELLNNTIKHADASAATISIIHQRKKINILFEDNGKGFNIETNKKRFGLSYIASRVSLLKGSVDIESKENMGTKCMIVIPVKTERLQVKNLTSLL